MGIFSLIAAAILSITNLSAMFIQIGLFMVTVAVGLLLFQLILLPIVYFAVTRKNPFTALLVVFKPWCVAFAATSS